jgi:hypothetical protein
MPVISATIAVIWIPIVLTVMTLLAAIVWPVEDSGMSGGLETILHLIVATFLIMLYWMFFFAFT